jgi:succinyl-diaminopimelate desuccinylase
MDDALQLLSTLVAIPSVNADLSPGAPAEAPIIDWCAGWLRDRGFTVEIVGSRDGHPSLVATLAADGAHDLVMLTGHVDTVGVATYRGDPYSASVRDGRIYGRGTFDMKGGLAAILVAAARVADRSAAGDPPGVGLVVALVADEEFGSVGTEDVLRWIEDRGLNVVASVVAEPSALELTVAHRGFAWFTLELTGRAAHGSQPEHGIDAIAGASDVIAALAALQRTLDGAPTHPLLAPGTVRVATINGGVDAATVAPSCTMTLERRTLPGETAEDVRRDLESSIATALVRSPGLGWSLRTLVARAAFESRPDSVIVRAVRAAAEDRLGRPVPARGEPFWTDAGLIHGAGIDCLVFGVAGGGAHSDEEWADVESVYALTDILENMLYVYPDAHSAESRPRF